MKTYWKEIAILAAQLFLFYGFPLMAGPTDAMGMVFLIIVATLILSLILGSASGKAIKYFYPLLVSLLFVPSVMIYYNESAMVHSAWYFVVSAVGLSIGSLLRCFCKRKC